MKATIITIGDEILIGQIVDTNSVSIAKHLNAAGIVVREKISIGDDRTQIIETAERALAGSEVTVEGRHHQKDPRGDVPQRHALRRTGGRAR